LDRTVFENFLGNLSCLNIVDGQIFVLHECNDVIVVTIVLQNLQYSFCHLKVGGTGCIYKYGVLDVQPPSLLLSIVSLLIHENQKTITKPIDFLPRRFKGARRLRLADTRNLHVYVEPWEIDPRSGTTDFKSV
jgi:hypothetical protein